MSARLISTQRHTHLQPEYVLKPEKTRIGRHPENDVVVMLESISRFHAEFEVQDGIIVLRDLGSRNGTYLNGHALRSSVPVRSGDRVQFGNVEFVFRSADLSEPAAKSVTDTNVVLGDARRTPLEVLKSKGFDTMMEELSQARATETGSELILELYQTCLWLRDSRAERDDLCRDLLHRMFRFVPASRAALLMRDDAASNLAAVAWLRRKESRQHSSPSIVIPQAITDAVEQNCRAVLMGDAATDERFRHSDSIHQQKISSAICVPLVIEQALMGVIYLDNQGDDQHTFTEIHLAFVGSVAQELAYAIRCRGIEAGRIGGKAAGAAGGAAAGGTGGARGDDVATLVTQVARTFEGLLKSDEDASGRLSLALDDGNLDEARRLWRGLRRGQRRLESLLADMFDFGRAYRPRRKPVHINEVILDTLDTFAEEVRNRRLDVRKTLARELHTWSLDEEAFYKAVLALLLNAVEAAPTGGAIEVVTHEGADGALHIDIIDNGPGLPAEVRARLFQPFNAGPDSKGAGMGLACTRRLVEAMGGALHLTSESGRGAQAALIFPAGLRADLGAS